MTRRARFLVAWSAGLLASACGEPPREVASPVAPESYAGGARCVSCHMQETELWRGSHHDRAMQVAAATTVLGDFADAEFTYNGVTSRFFRRGAEFWVSTDGPDGTLANFAITHTFGVEPLQQYLIALSGGRYQALGIAWDSRPRAAGGQRWFHLYPDDNVDAAHALHWTRGAQNWNTGCAECHSTGLDKNYAVASGTFATRWTDIDVNCEACHGPGSRHVADPAQNPLALARAPRAWVFAEGAAIATRVPALPARAELEACAQCHARRAQHGEDFRPAQDRYLDTFRPELLEAGLYHADGQIRDEVYEYGSFVQSAMHAAGVTCTDCHDPHSAKLRADGSALCAQCHLPARFDTRAHHRHEPGSVGAQCVECHMPATTYMIVDPRRDHSFRVPRPDLSVKLDVPNACNSCHADRTRDWAAATVAEWYPSGRHGELHYAEALAAGREWTAERGALLRALATAPEQPAIVKATGIALLGLQLDEGTLALIERQLATGEPLVQLAALEALAGAPPGFVVESAQRFLTDPARALRMAAARALLPARALLSERRREDLDRATEEYRVAQEFNMDRAEGLFNWGTALTALGRTEEAQRSLRAAIERDPLFSPAYVNLAELIRRDGREREAATSLREALALAPDDASLHFALGLSYVRSGDLAAAVAALARAAELGSTVPQYGYTLGVARYSAAERERGLETLRAVHERFPGHAETLVALATMLRDEGRTTEAVDYARKLVALSPADAPALRLLRELEASR